jgi:tetratricopeptide (TPR) repeat protein
MKLNQSDPGYVEALQRYLAGDWAGAREAFRALEIKYEPSPVIYLHLGDVEYSMGALDKAADLYQKAIGIQSDFGLAYYKAGVCLHRAGRLEQALKCFEKVIELKNQSHAMAAYFVGLINLFLGRDEAAIEGFKHLRRESRESRIANYYLAQLHIKRNEFPEALELLQELAEQTPHFAEVHYLLGVVNYRLHKITDAIHCFRKALELDPNDERSRSRLMQLTDVQWP